MKMYRKLSLLFLCLLLVIAGCAKKEKEKKRVEETSKMLVKIALVKRSSIKEIVSLSGDIHGYKEAKVYSKVAGKLYRRVKNEGDKVKKDGVIALVNRDEEGLKFSKAEIKSPISGVVTMYFIGLGDTIFPAQPVVSVASINKVKAIVYVGEEDMAKIKKGQIANIYTGAYPDKIFIGKVKEIAAALDRLSRKLKIEIEIENNNRLLKPGMFAKAEIITDVRENVLTIAKSALLENNEVFITEDGSARKITVKTGLSDEEKIQILKGLKENQQVITQGNYALSDGTKVEIVE